MKTYVFVFVPVRDTPHFRQRLHDCLANIPDAFARPHANEKAREKEYPYWTWFLPNPLPPPIERDPKRHSEDSKR